jgi:uncharacterized membrane protein YcaP (DUF421 family)
MIQEVWAGIRWALGLDVETLRLWQMALRTLIVYLAALVMIRLGRGQRFLGRHAAFDVILGILFGSVLSHAVEGSTPFFETLGAGFVLMSLHWLFAAIAFRSHQFGTLVKGSAQPLIQDGEIQWDKMSKNYISKEDLIEALRNNAHLSNPSEVEVAHIERNGTISVIPRDPEPHIIEITVEPGVQTVRVKLE